MQQLPKFRFALREDLAGNPEFLPQQAEPTATGFDVRAAQKNRQDLIIRPGEYFKIPLGFRAIPPEGWWYQLHPRSSSFAKKSMHSLIGIIDEAFPLELMFAGQYLPDTDSMTSNLIIRFGESIGQIIPMIRRQMIVEEITNEEYDDLCRKRNAIRTGGFGSTS